MATPRDKHARAARRLQSVFRGWRTRRRIVWAVRTELDAFMDEMEADVEMERLLLALPKPQVHTWHREGGREMATASRSWSLQLPRIEDDVFGWKASFPVLAQPAGNIAQWDTTQEPSAMDYVGQDGVVSAASSASPSPVSLGSEVVTESFEGVHIVEDHLSTRLESSEDEQQECASPPEKLQAITVASLDVDADRVHSASSEEERSEEVDVSIPTSVEPPTATAGPVEYGTRSGAPLTVDQIVTTHSRDAILLELEWARKALRERVQYLQSRQSGSACGR